MYVVVCSSSSSSTVDLFHFILVLIYIKCTSHITKYEIISSYYNIMVNTGTCKGVVDGRGYAESFGGRREETTALSHTHVILIYSEL